MKLLIALAAVVLVMIAFLVWFAPHTREWNPLPEIRNASHVDEARPTLADVEPRATAKAQSAANDALIGATRSIIHAATWQLAGFVLSADGKTPVPHASVGLFAPAKIGDGASSEFCVVTNSRGNEYALHYRCVRRWTATDETGRFVFDEPDAGTWIVRADLGALLACASDPIEITAGIPQSDLRLVMPAECWITGKVLAPEDARFEKMRVTLAPHGASSVPVLHGDAWRLDRMLVEAISGDGSFRVGPTETGLHALGIQLVGPGTDGGTLMSGNAVFVPITDVLAAPGEIHHDIDLRAGFPGSLRITVETTGAEIVELSSCTLFAIAALSGGSGIRSVAMHAQFGDGPVEMGPLVPGDWTLAVAPWPTRDWIWQSPELVHVEPARAIDVRLSIPFARDVLELRDAEKDEPYKQTEIYVGYGIDGVYDAQVLHVLNEPGKLMLTLPPARYRLAAATDDEGFTELSPVPEFEWTLDGPVPKVLHLRPK